MIDRLTAIILSLLLLGLGSFVGLAVSVHGPALFAYVAVAYSVVAVALLWVSYWAIGRRGYRHRSWLLVPIGILLGVAVVGSSQASWHFLIDLESAREERRAAATQVFNVHDEPLLSAKGNPIGIRLRYSIRFPTSDYFWQTPWLRTGKDLGVGIWADGRFSEPVVTPPLQAAKNKAPRYEQGKQYDLVADVLPYFLVQDKSKTKLCIVEPLPETRAGFDRLIASGEALHYKVGISGTKFESETENAYSPRTFYESALKEGAGRLEASALGGGFSPCQ